MILRYERKYRLEGFSYEAVRNMIETHPLGFSELYPDRQVNNIYLDTPDLEFFSENMAGVGDRRKYRIRWYGKDLAHGHKPVLEMKVKHNELGFKVNQQLTEDLKIESLEGLRAYISRNVQSTLPLEPVLLNAYDRSYLQSFDGRFRATIDFNLRFHSLEYMAGIPEFFAIDPVIILEVKYDQHWDEEWNSVAHGLPFRVGKNSKYVNGVLMTVL